MEKSGQFTNFELTMWGRANLSVKNGPGGAVRFRFDAADGSALSSGKIIGDRQLIDRAWNAGRATLAMCGKTLRVKVTAKVSTFAYVTIETASVLPALLALSKPAR
jgi:hypothetical protein